MGDPQTDRISQEFFCTISGGGCGKYFMIRLNPHINRVVEIVCPGCNHHHQRRVKDGRLFESGRHRDEPKEQIYAMASTLTTVPRSVKFLNKKGNERDSAVIYERSPELDILIKQTCFELLGGK